MKAKSHDKGRVCLLTGRIESGKTRFMAELARQLDEQGTGFAAILSHGIHKDLRREGFELEFLPGGGRRLLAIREAREGWIQQGRFHLDPEAFAAGSRWARDLLEGELLRPGLKVWKVRSSLLSGVRSTFGLEDAELWDVERTSPASVLEKLNTYKK